jgi:hypothetical protein
MKNSIKQKEVVENKLEIFLKTNDEFEFKKLFTEHPVFDTYEIKRKFKGEKRKINVLEIVRKNGGKEYGFLTTKCYHDLLRNINAPQRTVENGNKPCGVYLPLYKLKVWLKDSDNELLWFADN